MRKLNFDTVLDHKYTIAAVGLSFAAGWFTGGVIVAKEAQKQIDELNKKINDINSIIDKYNNADDIEKE